MAFNLIVTNGTQRGRVYEETSRFNVSVDSEDPKLSELLAEARKHPQSEYLESKKEFFYFMHSKTCKRLNENKRVSELALKSGDILRLMCSLR